MALLHSPAGELESTAGESRIGIPSPATLLLAPLLECLGELAIRMAVTVVLPSSAAGETGAPALATQATSIPNFDQEIPRDVLGCRLAFDIWPYRKRKGADTAQITDELRRIGENPSALQLVWGTIFHAITASVYPPEANADAVLRALISSGHQPDRQDGGGHTIDSPSRSVGGTGLMVSNLRPEPDGGTWL